MLTFETVAAGTVALAAADYRADAARYAESATEAVLRADESLSMARRAAAKLGETYRTPGGATAAYVVALVETDTAEVRMYAHMAAKAAEDAGRATDAVGASAYAAEAASHRDAAWDTADTTHRYAFDLACAALA